MPFFLFPIKLFQLKSYVFLILAWTFSLLFSASFAAEGAPSTTHYVLVSVAPHKFFVERIAGDTLKVGLMVPAGASSHTYEPTPKQMLAASNADLWFVIGETFENRASRAFQSHKPHLQLIDLRQGLDLITIDSHGSHCQHCKRAGSADLHIWISPRMAKMQAQTIAEALINRYPEHAQRYRESLAAFLIELDNLDHDIAVLMKTASNRTIMVSHPAYAYFCRDYGLSQLSIEMEGKDPTPQQLTNILNQARAAQIKTIFIQPQYNNKGANLIAQELGAQVVNLDPYSENYMQTMRDIANKFADKY